MGNIIYNIIPLHNIIIVCAAYHIDQLIYIGGTGERNWVMTPPLTVYIGNPSGTFGRIIYKTVYYIYYVDKMSCT